MPPRWSCTAVRAQSSQRASIAHASACPNIERLLLNEVNYQLRIARLKSSTRPGRANEALRQHYEIFEAIRDRDPERAERAMRHHISSARESIMAMMADEPAAQTEIESSDPPARLTATRRRPARRSAAAAE